EDVRRVLATYGSMAPPADLSLKKLAFLHDGSSWAWPESLAAAKKFASVRVQAALNNDWPTSASAERPPPHSLSDSALQSHPFLLRPQGDYRNDSTRSVVNDLSIRGQDGRMRYYRFHRLVRDPSGSGSNPDYFLSAWTGSENDTPTSSRWFIPYI